MVFAYAFFAVRQRKYQVRCCLKPGTIRRKKFAVGYIQVHNGYNMGTILCQQIRTRVPYRSGPKGYPHRTHTGYWHVRTRYQKGKPAGTDPGHLDPKATHIARILVTGRYEPGTAKLSEAHKNGAIFWEKVS